MLAHTPSFTKYYRCFRQMTFPASVKPDSNVYSRKEDITFSTIHHSEQSLGLLSTWASTSSTPNLLLPYQTFTFFFLFVLCNVVCATDLGLWSKIWVLEANSCTFNNASTLLITAVTVRQFCDVKFRLKIKTNVSENQMYQALKIHFIYNRIYDTFYIGYILKQ